MIPFILYQLKAGICIMMFTGLFYALFRKDTFHRINRFYLVSSLILSQILPAIKLQSFKIPSESGLTQFIGAVSIKAGDTVQAENFLERISPITIIYGVISILLVVYVIYQILRLLILLKQNDFFVLDKYRIITLPGKSHSFSFFNLIFISSSDSKSDENNHVLQHELAHASQWHSLDILLVQVIKIFQWYNPFIYLAEKALQETHEYLADEAVLEQNGDSVGYRMLLLSRVYGVEPAILSFFNYSLIKNRLAMMTKEKSPMHNRLKYLSVLPLIVLMSLLLGTTVAKSQNTEKQAIEIMTSDESNNPDSGDEPAFITVEEQALFQGGNLEDFRAWVQKNLVYPPVAVKNGIYGRIIVQFAVNSKGKICDVKVLRGVDPLLDQEALRVINLSPVWKPAKQGGKNVKQQFVMPIIFQLS